MLSIEGIGHSLKSEGKIITVLPCNLWYSVIYVRGKERYVMVCKMYIDNILLLSLQLGSDNQTESYGAYKKHDLRRKFQILSFHGELSVQTEPEQG